MQKWIYYTTILASRSGYNKSLLYIFINKIHSNSYSLKPNKTYRLNFSKLNEEDTISINSNAKPNKGGLLFKIDPELHDEKIKFWNLKQGTVVHIKNVIPEVDTND